MTNSDDLPEIEDKYTEEETGKIIAEVIIPLLQANNIDVDITIIPSSVYYYNIIELARITVQVEELKTQIKFLLDYIDNFSQELLRSTEDKFLYDREKYDELKLRFKDKLCQK